MSKKKRKNAHVDGKRDADADRKRDADAEGDANSNRGADLAHQALETDQPETIEDQIAKLSPEEARLFLAILEIAMKKRRIQLAGYLLSLVAVIGGVMYALYIYGSSPRDSFMGWIFLLPFALVGIILFTFGRWARAVGRREPTVSSSEQDEVPAHRRTAKR